MAGYDWTRGMSNNAVNAYENGEKPMSKWTKSALLEEIGNLGWNVEAFRKFKVADLKSVLLDESSWHHTSKYFNETTFYQISPYMFEEMALAKLNGETFSDENDWCEDAWVKIENDDNIWMFERRISKNAILVSTGIGANERKIIVSLDKVKKYED